MLDNALKSKNERQPIRLALIFLHLEKKTSE